ncbi:PAS domain S-box protein [Deltaproteobacteria bacterium TL4]
MSTEAKMQAILNMAADGIINIDEHGIIELFNPAAERLFGYSSAEMLGENVKILMPEPVRLEHDGYLKRYSETGKKNIIGKGREQIAQRKDGTMFPMHIAVSEVQVEGRRIFTGIVHDLSDLKQAQWELQKLLEEKEILLQEIHHRVKNNLQIISSLLRLQSEYIEDAPTQAIFNESRDRINAMALVHNKLYQFKDLVKLDLSVYLTELVQGLRQSYGFDSKEIQLNLEVEPVILSVNQVIPCALIINELLSNALKYAFLPEQKPKEIGITFLLQKNQQLVLEVRDNGIGLPKGLNLKKIETLGFEIVETLVRQLRGSMEVEIKNGSLFRICFKQVQT